MHMNSLFGQTLYKQIVCSKGGHLMSIVYKCRHCKYTIGTLRQQIVSTSMLGIDVLTTKEKEKMVHYKENGDVHIHAICENCEDTLQSHPNYYELDYFLH